MVDGRLRQLGTPAELLARPADAFVASLTGGNLLTGEARPLPGGGSEVALAGGDVLRSTEAASGRVGVAVHPWDVQVERAAPPAGANAVAGTVGTSTLHGGRTRVRVGAMLAERSTADAPLDRGETAYAVVAPEAVRLIPLDDRRPS